MRIRNRPTKQGEPSWYYRFTDPDTRKRVERRGGRTRKAAERKLRETLDYIDRYGTLRDVAPKKAPALKAWGDTYLEVFCKDNAPFTQRQKAWQIKRLVEYFGVQKRVTLGGITPLLVDGYKNWRQDQGRTIMPRTINSELAVLRHLWNCAYDEGLVRGQNPVKKGLFLKQGGRRHVELLTCEDFDRLIEACAPDRRRALRRRARDRDNAPRTMVADTPTLADLVLFLRFTGCRLGEALGLRVEDVDLRACTLTFEDTKNGESRTLPVPLHVVALLKRQDTSGGFYFGGEAHRNRLKHAWRRTRVRAGFPHLRLHDLRHMASTWMQRQGVDALSCEALLGHKLPGMLGHYGHATREGLVNAISKLGNSFPPETARVAQMGHSGVLSVEAKSGEHVTRAAQGA